ncbi:hypothetical protein DB347_25390 [Opitutaceae bacterium EW11]|nr:hypothetical protein DB347_25390 [Opitutaceae bacterium EW11]
MPRTLLILDETSIGMAAWSKRWWIDRDVLYSGVWDTSMGFPVRYRLRSWTRIKPEQKRILLEKLSPLALMEGTFDVCIEQDESVIHLSHSPTYAIDYRRRYGETILVADDMNDLMSDIVSYLNTLLPKDSRISWAAGVGPSTLKKRPNQSLEPTPPAVTPRADARVAPAVGVAHH